MSTIPCRDCGATLRFVKMRTGSAMPCDAVADPAGNVAALLSGGRYVDGRVLTKADPVAAVGETLFMPHKATCPESRAKKPAEPRPIQQPQLF